MRLTRFKIFRIVFVVLFSLFLLFVLAAALFIYLYPKERLLQLITTKAEQSLDRKITVEQLDYSIKGVLLDKVKIYEGMSIDDQVLAQSESVNLKFSVVSMLFDKKLVFDSISLKNCKITVRYDSEGISNLKKLIDSIKGKGASKSSAAFIENINLSNATFTLINPPKVLKPLEGSYTIFANLDFLKNKGVYIHDCSIRLPETRGHLYPDLTVRTEPNNFNISGKVKLVNASLKWVYLWGKNPKIPYDVVNGNVTNLVITRDSVSGHANATSTLMNSPLLVYADGNCHVNIKGKTVLLSNIKGKIRDSSFMLQKMLFMFNGKFIHFTIDGINAFVDDVRPILTFLPNKLSGKVEGDLNCQNAVYNGNLRLTNVSFDQQNKLVTDLNTIITITNNTTIKKDIPIRILNQPSFVSIAITDPKLSKIFIDVRSGKLFIDENKFAGPKSDSRMNLPLEITGRIVIDEFKYNTITLSKLDIHYSIFKSTIAVNSVTTQFLGGTINGKGSVDMSQAPARASISVQLNNIKIQQMDIVKEKLNERLFGLINGRGVLNFNMDRNLSKTITGRVEIQINKGKLVNTGIQNGLGIFLSELKYKLNNLEFNTIYGNFSIDGDTFKANSIIFNSENIRLKIEGIFNSKLSANPLQIDLEFNKHFIQDLPGPVALGLNKYSSSENWYVIPFSVSGDITDSKNLKRLR